MNREELLVAAIENGTVIDHIPTSKVFEVVNLLHLSEVKTSIMVGWNLKSHKMGRKSIIKIADKYFSDSELNQLSVVAPNVSLCVIKDYQVVEKKQVVIPEELRGIVKCAQCAYCEKEQSLDHVELV